MSEDVKLGWVQDSSSFAMKVLEDARDTGRPVILLTGAGISADSGFPLAMELKEYLVQIRRYVFREGFSNFRQYIEEARWPSRHDLRVELMLKAKALSLVGEMRSAEREATQAALVAELRRDAPSLAFSLQEIFEQLDPLSPQNSWKQRELGELYGSVKPLAECLGKRSPKNIAYRSLLADLCDNNQTTIDACFDHFIRDREPTTTHQFIYFLSRILRIPVILTTNFDPLLENAFSGEGLQPRVYEVRGEESIPSARLLLSQPLSIVKLHGGTHQMQTGFNLDDPLSPAALAAFGELYDRLQRTYGQAPLTLVIGYSGSDRRVMDIVASQVREWPREEPGNLRSTMEKRPRILWVSKDPWQPEQLSSAVKTHPTILQGGLQADSLPQYPVHLVRYRDGRLFLLESLQTLLRHFPIARSHYQAVNFVIHSVSGKDRSSENAKHFTGDRSDWRIALIHTAKGGGSSSTLVSVSQELERSDDCRTIWIDLTEIPGVPALIDVISERITKLDMRLQPVRRPPLLRSLLDGSDEMEETNFAKASRDHEMRACVQWLRHALRRGKYLLALDSLDEFPCEHPAVWVDKKSESSTGANQKPENPLEKQRKLMCQLIRDLAEEPGLIGDSRIALAFSTVPAESTGNSPFEHMEELARFLKKRASRDPLIRVPDIESTPLISTRWEKALAKWGQPPTPPSTRASAREQETASSHVTHEKANISNSEKEEILPGFSQQKIDILKPFIYTVITLISCCHRRIRSEVLLRRCVGEYIGRLSPVTQPDSHGVSSNKNRITHLIDRLEKNKQKKSGSGSSSSWMSIPPKRHPITVTLFAGFSKELESIWGEPAADRQHLNDRAIPDLDNLIRQCIHQLSGHEDTQDKRTGIFIGQERQWLYRTEGAYHWMHSDIRNGLYKALQNAPKKEPLAMAHHVIALFCYDELYERSRDARAFLEYLFHRVASIRLAVNIKTNSALNWITRLLISLHREKHALLTRVRLPGFIRQITQLRIVIDEIQSAPPENDSESSRQRASDLMGDLLRLLSDFLLASGHPHSAFSDSLSRLRGDRKDSSGGNDLPLKISKKKVLEQITGIASHRLGELNEKLLRAKETSATKEVPPEEIEGGIKAMAIFRDLAYSCHDPILSPISFPVFPQSNDRRPAAQEKDWVELMDNGGENDEVAERADRINLCYSIYSKLAELREESFEYLDNLQPWTHTNQAGDFFGGMVRKSLEFQMIYHAESWIESSKVYLSNAPTSKSPTAQDSLREFCIKIATEKEKVAKREKEKSRKRKLPPEDEKIHQAGELGDDQPLLRRSRRRQRHECYRLCLMARLKAADKLSVARADEVVEKLLGDGGLREWEKIRRLLDDAESILNRSGGFADQQAMAITRLTCAELLVRRAELLCWGADDASKDQGGSTTQFKPGRQTTDPVDNPSRKEAAPRLRLACSQCLDEAFTMMSTVEKLMNEGRGENRWRFFYLLALSRAYLLRAFTLKEKTRRQALTDMGWAARHLTGAINNCGLWTDRYDILLWWWHTWEEVAKTMHEGRGEQDRYFSFMLASLGTRWGEERAADRFGRIARDGE